MRGEERERKRVNEKRRRTGGGGGRGDEKGVLFVPFKTTRPSERERERERKSLEVREVQGEGEESEEPNDGRLFSTSRQSRCDSGLATCSA